MGGGDGGRAGAGRGGVKREKSIMGALNLQGLETTFLTPEVFSKGPPKAQCPSNSPNTPSEYSCQSIVGTGWPLSGSVSSPRGRWAGSRAPGRGGSEGGGTLLALCGAPGFLRAATSYPPKGLALSLAAAPSEEATQRRWSGRLWARV